MTRKLIYAEFVLWCFDVGVAFFVGFTTAWWIK